MSSPLTVVHACYNAYVKKDRAAIEEILADDYRFTSPLDNRLNRATYLDHCWPNSKALERFDFIYELEQNERAFVVYEARTTKGKRFRNSEVHIVRNGKLVETEVYFGWDLPHKAPTGGFVENEGDGHA